MKISFDLDGCYTEHAFFFDWLYKNKSKDDEIGVLSGMRPDQLNERIKQMGVVPDFVIGWGEAETISNGNRWKAKQMHDNGISVHFDQDATEIKRYTDKWVLKTMNSNNKDKF